MNKISKTIIFLFFLITLSFVLIAIIYILSYRLPYQHALNYPHYEYFHIPYGELSQELTFRTTLISFLTVPVLNYLAVLVFCLLFRVQRFKRTERVILPITSSIITFSIILIAKSSEYGFMSASDLSEFILFMLLFVTMAVFIYMGSIGFFTETIFYLRKKLPRIRLSS